MRALFCTIGLLVATFSNTPAQQRACEPAPDPKHLPAVRTLVDSAAAIADLAAIAAPDGMVFSLALHEGDSVLLVRSLFGTDSMAAGILARSIRAQRRADEPWAIRLRATGAPTPALRVERAMYCPPEFIPGSQSGAATVAVQEVPHDRELRFGARSEEIGFKALVSETGAPLRLNMIHTSGDREIDAQLLERWQRAQFRPALLDGLPVQAWYRSDRPTPERPPPPPSDDDSIYEETAVDERPQMVSMPPVAYPEWLRQRGIQGHVVIQAIVDKNGHAESKSVRVIETTNQGFNQPATSVVKLARFRPGSIQGRAVRVRVSMPIDFTIKH